MKRTTIFIDEAVERDLDALARRENRSRSQLVRQALDEYLERRRPADFSLGFVASGASGRSDIAERHEEILFTDLDPHGAPPQG